MSLAGCKVNVLLPGAWRDSFDHRPSKFLEMWVCNGVGGEVAPVVYVGQEFNCFHGLYGLTPELLDDHYFWMPRHPGVPPATKAPPPPQIKFEPTAADVWTKSSEQLPKMCDWVWINDGVCGPKVAWLEEIEPNSGLPIFRSINQHKYRGHRHWAPLVTPKGPYERMD